jgi:hypothetical protein
MKSYQYFLPVLLCFFLFQYSSCPFRGDIVSVTSVPVDTGSKKTDSVIKDIPLTKRGEPRMFYINKNLSENKLKLTTLENGTEFSEFRLWYTYASNDTAQLVILKDTGKRWQAELYNLIYRYTEKYDSLLSIDKHFSTSVPVSGWSNFIKQLKSSNIEVLPDKSLIKEYPEMTDGDEIIVEVADAEHYRIYHYQLPGMLRNDIPEANDMNNIMSVIQQELKFKQLREF